MNRNRKTYDRARPGKQSRRRGNNREDSLARYLVAIFCRSVISIARPSRAKGGETRKIHKVTRQFSQRIRQSSTKSQPDRRYTAERDPSPSPCPAVPHPVPIFTVFPRLPFVIERTSSIYFRLRRWTLICLHVSPATITAEQRLNANEPPRGRNVEHPDVADGAGRRAFSE